MLQCLSKVFAILDASIQPSEHLRKYSHDQSPVPDEMPSPYAEDVDLPDVSEAQSTSLKKYLHSEGVEELKDSSPSSQPVTQDESESQKEQVEGESQTQVETESQTQPQVESQTQEESQTQPQVENQTQSQPTPSQTLSSSHDETPSLEQSINEESTKEITDNQYLHSNLTSKDLPLQTHYLLSKPPHDILQPSIDYCHVNTVPTEDEVFIIHILLFLESHYHYLFFSSTSIEWNYCTIFSFSQSFIDSIK